MTSWQPDLGARQGPRYLAIANAVSDAIDRGELKPGMRLPTHRDLAYRLGLSVHTVSQAYAEAERRGHVSGETGRGTFVQGPRHDNARNFIMDRRRTDLIDLSIVRPVIGAIHRTCLQDAFTALAADAGDPDEADFPAMLACRPVSGFDGHREAGARWLDGMGVRAAPPEVLITNGVAQGLSVALATLTEPGDMVLCEQMTDHGIVALCSIFHTRLKGLPCDGHGLRPEAFEAACAAGPVKVLVCTPTLHNPTASTMPAGRRERIVEIARRYDVMIVEDDVYRPLVVNGPPALWTLAPERTCYATGFSKSAMSGLRTGYLVAAEPLVHRLAMRLRAMSWMATPLVAELASRWIEDGTLQRLTAWQRNAIAERQSVVREGLSGWMLSGDSAALHAWLSLPGGWRADNFVALARLRHIALTTPAPFMAGRDAEPAAVRICLGPPATLDELREGIAGIAEVLEMGPEPIYLDM